MSFFVYVLKSELDGKHYVGSTEDLEIRLMQHNQGRCQFTKGHRPWKLAYHEIFSTRTEALKQENFYKSGIGRKILKEQILKEVITN